MESTWLERVDAAMRDYGLTSDQAEIMIAVIDALREAEALGGPVGIGYVRLMLAVQRHAATCLENYVLHGDFVRDVSER